MCGCLPQNRRIKTLKLETLKPEVFLLSRLKHKHMLLRLLDRLLRKR
jgi:hypothetical protein